MLKNAERALMTTVIADTANAVFIRHNNLARLNIIAGFHWRSVFLLMPPAASAKVPAKPAAARMPSASVRRRQIPAAACQNPRPPVSVSYTHLPGISCSLQVRTATAEAIQVLK